MQDFFADSNGPWLAVLDGRFLPAENPTCNVDTDTRMEYTINGNISKKMRTKVLSVSFSTRRAPDFRHPQMQQDSMKVYNREQLLELTEIFSIEYDASSFDSIHEVTAEARTWELSER